ncbi:MAG: hypothetical protein KJ674_01520 [Nanoarchaeota archaeon]|nr:hypothetical protein [Nanoarchaeota archaeon]
MDWRECKYKKLVKEISVDHNLVKSLINSSDKRLISNNRLKLDETTAATKLSIVYESLREVLEAVATLKGFKIYNHECFCAFLNEICKDYNSSNNFNRFRIIRNKINYYGNDVDKNEAKNLIEDIVLLRKNLIKNYLK